ncbi:C1q-like domain-containing protein [Paenibacillus harenae]|uniref:C1q domain-containing protein n=1 Tax=Paenibacillus harenae TaxID=306543 RepID=A0ABT9UB50_PAEHA|nr:hypothetical protein [Paenibacillus harenae]MDQ0116243.1 hypothetical protein [Paenibacillus harenae]
MKSKPTCKKTVFKKTVCKQVVRKRCDGKRFKGRKSAFIAVSGTDQTLNMGQFMQVQFQVEEVDLNNEYNPATSTFRPKQAGLYSLVASVSFSVVTMSEVDMRLEIRVNGVARIFDSEHFFPRDNIIDAAGIVKLEARDTVQVFARAAGENGTINGSLGTRFEGFKI